MGCSIIFKSLKGSYEQNIWELLGDCNSEGINVEDGHLAGPGQPPQQPVREEVWENNYPEEHRLSPANLLARPPIN